MTAWTSSGTADAPDALIELCEAMHDYSSSNAGAELIAEIAYEWCKGQLAR
jgi:hypothetical protein